MRAIGELPASGGASRLLIWSIEETVGFDTAWSTVQGTVLTAEGRSSGLLPVPFWLDYRLETTDEFVTGRMAVDCRWPGGSATLDLRRDRGHWTVNGKPRVDLDDALDCDLMACPLTNTMPILRHGLHLGPGDERFLMAFIEVPSLRVVPSPQRYTYLAPTDGGALIRFRSGSFQSDLTIDRDGFVVDYPTLGRRLAPPVEPEQTTTDLDQ
jgi:hypothetical protein